MKPEDLKPPFHKKEQRILVHDRVWYVPEQYACLADFSFPGWNHSLFFENNQPICLEYCSGNGAWIAAKAQSQKDYNWVAIERKFDRVRKVWSKIKNFELSNLMVICGEGHQVTSHYIPNGSVYSVFINFPDPWPKKRHAKHRIVQLSFIQEISRILQPGGMLTIVTDDNMYSQLIINVLQEVKDFESIFCDPFYVTDYPSYGSSYFEDLWRQKGKNILYHAFRKLGRIYD